MKCDVCDKETDVLFTEYNHGTPIMAWCNECSGGKGDKKWFLVDWLQVEDGSITKEDVGELHTYNECDEQLEMLHAHGDDAVQDLMVFSVDKLSN